MSTTVESLELQIKSDSQAAISGVEALAESLGRLKSATIGGLGFKSIAKNLTEVKNSVDNMGNVTNKLNGLSRAVNELSRLGNVKVSASIGNQIKNIGTALSSLNTGGASTKITELVGALKPLETLGKSTLGATVTALGKLPKALDSIDTRKLYSQIQSLTRIMRPLATEMEKISKGFSSFPSRIQKLIKENEKLTQSKAKLTKSTGSLSQANTKTGSSYLALGIKTTVVIAAIKKLTQAISSAVKKISDYVENVNLFNVAMGEYASEAGAYAEQVGAIMGIDPGEWMRNQGTFMTLATGFGVTSERAYTMSKNLTQLGYDISSFFNLPYEDAMEKLQSGLAGELEPLRRIGYDLSQARLQQEAYTLGINKKLSAMTQAEKAELRYHTIMKQVTVTHGDMARTLDAPANQLRIFKAELEQTARAIGSIFIPAIQSILPYVIAVVKLIKMAAEALANLVGYEAPKIGDMGVGSLASGAEEASDALDTAADNAKKLKRYTMGFDELNVIDPDQGSSSSGTSYGGSGFDFSLLEYDFLGSAVEGKAESIVQGVVKNLNEVPKAMEKIAGFTGLDKLWEDFGKAAETAKPTVDATFKAVETGYTAALPNMQTAANSVVASAQTTSQTTSKVIGDVVTIGTNNVSKYVQNNQGTLSEFVTNILNNISNLVKSLSDQWKSLVDIFGKVWEERGKPAFDALSNALIGIGDTLVRLYNEWIAPVIDWIAQSSTDLWNNHLSGLWQNICECFFSLTESISTLWNNWLKPFVDSLVNSFGPFVTTVVTGIGDIVMTVIGLIIDSMSGMFKSLTGVSDFLTGVFSGDWARAWEGIKTIFIGIWDSIWGIIKGIINLIISAINLVIGAIWTLIGGVINGIGDLASTIGSWFGQNWHFEIPVQPPAIPKLMAEGGFPETGEMFIAREAGP